MRPVVLILISLLALSGCSALSPQEVKPWERGRLASDAMQLESDSMDGFADDHIYFSKEASTGGKGVGGGGCGCN